MNRSGINFKIEISKQATENINMISNKVLAAIVFICFLIIVSCNERSCKKIPEQTEWYLNHESWKDADETHTIILKALDKGPVIKNNPVIDYMGSADPSTQVVGDKLYIYPSHDAFKNDYQIGFAMFDYHIYSTTNLLDYKDHGIALRGIDIRWKNYQGASHCYDPSAITVGDSTYFYFFLAQNAKRKLAASMGVAVAANPAGPFRDARGTPLINYTDMPDHQAGSPQAFFDFEGNPWLIWGAWGRTGIRRLKKNMIEFEDSSEYIELTNYLHHFKEAPWLYKYNGKYYLTYTARDNGEEIGIRYAIAAKVQGPYIDIGVIMHPHNLRTHHHSIVNFHDQWYIFYHIECNGNDYYRLTCAEYLFHNDDGTIALVRPTQAGIGRKNALYPIEGEKFFKKHRAEIHDHPENKEKKVLCIVDGGWALYNGVVFNRDIDSCKIILSKASKGRLWMEVDGKTVAESESDGSVKKLIVPVNIRKGEKEVRLLWKSSEGSIVIDKFVFESNKK